jgi:hypothetical protein
LSVICPGLKLINVDLFLYIYFISYFLVVKRHEALFQGIVKVWRVLSDLCQVAPSDEVPMRVAKRLVDNLRTAIEAAFEAADVQRAHEAELELCHPIYFIAYVNVGFCEKVDDVDVVQLIVYYFPRF